MGVEKVGWGCAILFFMQKRTIIIIALAIIIIVSIVMTVMGNTSGFSNGGTTTNDQSSRNADGTLNLETTADGTRYVSDPNYTPEEQKPATLFIGGEEESVKRFCGDTTTRRRDK